MKRSRRATASILAVVLLSLPLPGCSANDPVGGAIFKTALGVGAAVGTFYLVEQLK
jgi:hypothetical protein